jgi:hypothetical protein
MPRPRPGQRITIRARREPSAGPMPVPPVVECPACGRKVRAADLDGMIGPHERPAQPGDDGHSEIVPTYTACTITAD